MRSLAIISIAALGTMLVGSAVAQTYQPVVPAQPRYVIVQPVQPNWNQMIYPNQQTPATPQQNQVFRAQTVTPPGPIPNANMYNNGVRK